MNRGRVYAILAAVFLLSIMLTGCGGGGGGIPGPSNETRSVNSVGNNVETSVGSRFAKTVTLNWVGDTTGTVYGQAKFDSVNKTAGTGTLEKNADGTATLINDLAVDTFRFDFSTHHLDDPTDPNRLEPASGSGVIHITPEAPRVITPGGGLSIPQDGTLALVAQAQNGRATGQFKIEYVPVPSLQKTRAFVTAPATWSATPANAVTITTNSGGTATIKTKTGFFGSVKVTATLVGSTTSVSADITVVPHPAIGISSPAEGATIGGTVTVTFAAQNAVTVDYKIDAGSFTTVSGSSFTFDSTKLSNGTHSITMRVVGPLETATAVRTFNAQNTTGGDKKGDITIDPNAISTNQDDKNYINAARYVFKDGGAVTVSDIGLVRFWNPDGTLSATNVDLMSDVYTFTVDNLERIWIPLVNKQATTILSKSGAVVKTITNGQMTNARYATAMNEVLVCGPAGLISFDATFNKKSILNTYTYCATSDGTYYFYQGSDKKIMRRLITAPASQASEQIGTSGILFDMYAVPGYDLLIGTDRSTKTIYRSTKSGDTTGFGALMLPGALQLSGIGLDLRDLTGTSMFFTPTPNPAVYSGTVKAKP